MVHRITIPRQLLLVEIERRCPDPTCNARVRVGLTKEEARAYRGFECGHCGQVWDDKLAERDIRDWWDELNASGPETVREAPVSSRK